MKKWEQLQLILDNSKSESEVNAKRNKMKKWEQLQLTFDNSKSEKGQGNY